LNKSLPKAHMELEFDMLGIIKKIVKNVDHLCKSFYLKNIYIFFSQGAQIINDRFLVSRNFRDCFNYLFVI
jgi:hypothetical protein